MPDSPGLREPTLRAFDHGIGTLSLGGELRGYLASVVGNMTFPSRQPWLWFLIIWADGRRERPFEDYGPDWPTVRELSAGRLEHFGPSTDHERRFLGLRFRYSSSGEPCIYDFAWLAPEDAAAKWTELGLTDADF